MKGLLMGILLAAGLAASAAAETIENEFVRVEVDRNGGVIMSVHYKPATTLPLIADKGASVAGLGRFLAARLQMGDVSVDLSGVTMRKVAAKDGAALALQSRPVEGLTWTRAFTLDKSESGFRASETFRNDTGRDTTLSLAVRNAQTAQPWRQNLRCWFGDRERNVLRVAPAHAGTVDDFATDQGALFWRVLSQYNIGLLIVARAPKGFDATHHLPAEPNNPASFEWTAREVKLPKGGTASFTYDVMIDEGGRQGNDASQLIDSDRTVATVDLRAAGMPGDVLPGAVTVASALPRKVRTTVTQYELVDGRRTGGKPVAEFTDDLTPGASIYHPFDVTARNKGQLLVEAVVADDKGKKLMASSRTALIDGSDAEGELADVWKLYRTRMPETVHKGTWEEIGARALHLKPKDAATDQSRAHLALLQKHYPLYVRMLKGAAARQKVDPARLVGRTPDEKFPGTTEACMNVFFNGPDGPINCFSKERSGTNLNGLSYTKVLPDQGHRFHVYMGGYGVNSAGLSMSGASLNCDADTQRITEQRRKEWLAAGKLVAPPLWQWSMFATCTTVDEALAMITNPEMPVAGEVNYLLVDRQGNAAKVQGWGITHAVTRYEKGGDGFFAVGNYPLKQPDGLFKIGGWAWAANTMLRERFLRLNFGSKQGAISLQDAVAIMETHAAAGMCQHLYDNTGSLYSSCSFIAVPRTGELWLSQGPPCRVYYHRYSLNDE